MNDNATEHLKTFVTAAIAYVAGNVYAVIHRLRFSQQKGSDLRTHDEQNVFKPLMKAGLTSPVCENTDMVWNALFLLTDSLNRA